MNRSLIYWKDGRGCLNVIDYHLYRSPIKGELLTDITPRISVNRFAVFDRKTLIEDLGGVYDPDVERLWRSEISVLATEVPFFAEWIAAIFKAIEKGRHHPIPPPPCDCYVGTEGYPESNYIWSVSAWNRQCQYNGDKKATPGILKLRRGVRRAPIVPYGEGIQKMDGNPMETSINA
jgi:hypothetical protein